MSSQSRRGFLSGAGAAAGAAMLGISLPQFLTACRESGEARSAETPFKTLSLDEATELEAIAACIVPTTDTPGAREAGAIHFIDNILGSARHDLLEPLRAGLADLRARAQSTAKPAGNFSGLDAESQIAMLTEVENTSFFTQIRLLTVAGMFSDPSYGGNRDQIGWKLIGFDGHFGTQPPFGWYDAQKQDQKS